MSVENPLELIARHLEHMQAAIDELRMSSRSGPRWPSRVPDPEDGATADALPTPAEQGLVPYGMVTPIFGGGLVPNGMVTPTFGGGLVPNTETLQSRPFVVRDVRRTVVHDYDGTETTIGATEELRTVDPRTGAQTFLTTEHQFMSTDGQLITPTTTLYTCPFCRRRLLTQINHCTACRALVCQSCVAISTSEAGVAYLCPAHAPRKKKSFLEEFAEALFS